MQAETCEYCERPIRMMCQFGTGYCSLNCEDADQMVQTLIGAAHES